MMIFNISVLKYLSRALVFSLIYYFFTNESIISTGLILFLNFILIKLLDYFQSKNCSFQYIISVALLLVLPLCIENRLELFSLPFGYQYIYISLISSLIYIDTRKLDLNKNLFQILSNSFIASIAPASYLSGPSATLKETEKLNKQNFGLPRFDYLKESKIKLALSGAFRISLGFYLNTLNPFLLNQDFFSINKIIFFKLTLLIIFGFYNFWRYYLLFSGASELCKALLSIFEIEVIDNFKDPETSIFYHEIWSKWHLNITQRIKDFLYTPITLYSLRRFNYLNNNMRFLVIEGMPVAILFFVLSLWHGGKILDIVFAISSTFLTLTSRAISQNFLLIGKLKKLKFLEEIIRFISISSFGLVLGIYDFNNEIISNNNDYMKIFRPFIFTVLIYCYYRMKIKSTKYEPEILNSKNLDLYITIFEMIMVIYINLFLIIDLNQIDNFIYFSN